MIALRWIAAALFIACIPLALLLTNVRVAGTWERAYGYSYTQYEVPRVTGIERSELDRASSAISHYFQSARSGELLDIRAQQGERTIPLFNEREILHMADVKDLFQTVFRIHEFALLYVIIYITAVYLWSRERSMRHLARQAVWAGVGTVAILGAAAITMLFGFDEMFHRFHVLSFSNDFWQLDPRTDRLVQMFPQGFWFDVSLAVGAVTVMQGGLVALMGVGYIVWLDRRAEQRRLQRRRRAVEAATA
ncbi:MAG: TIGR01906 family membrane protein [Chloroflexi bacterium]|nr:TIGR01906 family membrane protein [Chloroflexota bacterium]MDA1240396.1 TIGR01906 family membrane protein [Chloroflexota bacterium]